MSFVSDDGWSSHNIWEHSKHVRDLYLARARDEAEEMTCAAQAAELLAPMVRPGDSVLDVGCGSGWFFHSLRRRGIEVDYWGIDATEGFVEIARRELSKFGLPPERIKTVRLEDLRAEVDHVVCMNVLSNIDSYHRPLERLLHAARHSLTLRESLGNGDAYLYVKDDHLDSDVDLRVHVNRYDTRGVKTFILGYGFDVREEVDRRTGGLAESVIGYPHHWTFLVAERRGSRRDA